MGRDKALLEIDGLQMVARTALLLGPLVAAITMVGPREPNLRFPYDSVPDDVPGLGPLGGIATALRATSHDWNLILGCDLPYLTRPWLRFLIIKAFRSSADVMLPKSDRGPEPLCAVYHARCAPVISAALERGVRKVTEGLAGLVIETLPHAEWKAFDSDGSLFKNMNSPADYEWARARLKGKLPE